MKYTLGCDEWNCLEPNILLSEFHAPHLDEILGDFGYPLLAFMDRKIRPIDQLFVDLGR